MKIIVLNGSPKGNNSITLQTINFLKAHFRDELFDVINVGQLIRKFQKAEEFDICMDKIIESDLILLPTLFIPLSRPTSYIDLLNR
jgi:hypothetical protein